jgi:glycosyltransferase involved in cell wall biosynthesis
LKCIHLPRRLVREAWGGTETVVLQSCKHLNARGVDSPVFTSMALATGSRDQLEGVTIRRFGHFYPYWGLSRTARQQLDFKGGNLFSWSLLWQLWREPGVDLFHLHTGKRMGGIARWVARRRGLPYVISLHGGVYDVPGEESQSLLQPTAGCWEWGKLLGAAVGSRRVLADASAILCLGKSEQRQLQQEYPGLRVELFPNGVEIARFSQSSRPPSSLREELGVPQSGRLFLSVARLDPQKDQWLALEILAQMPPEDHLVLAGPVTDPPYWEKLQARMQADDVRGRVHYLGSLSGGGLVDLYHAADALLLTSRHEPFGIVALEAWAAGLPVVARAVGGLVDLIEDGRTGYLLGPDASAASWRERLENWQNSGQIAAAGREQATRHYSWESLGGRLQSLYQEVCREHSRRK